MFQINLQYVVLISSFSTFYADETLKITPSRWKRKHWIDVSVTYVCIKGELFAKVSKRWGGSSFWQEGQVSSWAFLPQGSY